MKSRLVNYREGEDDLVFLLDRHRITVGRDFDNMIQLPDERISKHHAVLIQTQDGWVIEDLKSSNGVFVNGQKVERAELKGQDLVKIGPFDFYFETNLPSHEFVPAYILDASAHSAEQTIIERRPPSQS